MSVSNDILAEPLSLGQEKISRRANAKVIVLSSLAIGFAVAVFFSPLQISRGEIEEPATDMVSLSCPTFSMPMGPASISVMQEKLQQHGIPPSPLGKYALTQFAASRDISMAAQAREAFLELDPVTQAKVTKLSKDVVVRASSLKPEEMAGATMPLGFFDPAGLSKNSKVEFLRAAELKHGRVCMLATLGFVVSEKFHPIFDGWGEGAFKSATASHFAPTAMENFWPAFLALNGFHEYYTEFVRSKGEPMTTGDFGFDPLGLTPKTAEGLKTMQNKELNNGRLAILAASGLIAQELATGKAVF